MHKNVQNKKIIFGLKQKFQIQVKSVEKYCAFDFFYTLKTKNCRSPPKIHSQK